MGEHEQGHGHGHGHGPAAAPDAFWDSFYAGQPWSGRPNPMLVEELTTRPAEAGTALDLGCGTGADAIWLAAQGWTVTGLDLSTGALEQAAEAAAAAGVEARWLRHDLAHGVPPGAWDLVAATYLHSPVELPRGAVLRSAASAVAPGGTLLVIGHVTGPGGQPGPGFPTAQEVLATLGLDGWTTERAEDVTIEVTGADGTPTTRVDSVVRLRRG